MRTLHQVAPGEPTVADVPVGAKDWLRMAAAGREREEELVEAGAA